MSPRSPRSNRRSGSVSVVARAAGATSRARAAACTWAEPVATRRSSGPASASSSSCGSATVAQGRGDAVDGQLDVAADQLVVRALPVVGGATPAQHLDLQVVQRLEVGEA